jgi:hypothetical protein
LNLRYTSQNLFDQTYGNVTLQAATLGSGTGPQPVTLLNPQCDGTGFSFSFLSETARTYTAQFTPSLNPIQWQDFTNLPGNGAVITITNRIGSAPQCQYRVRTE